MLSLFFKLFLIQVWLLYNVVLVSGVPQSNSLIHASAAAMMLEFLPWRFSEPED